MTPLQKAYGGQTDARARCAPGRAALVVLVMNSPIRYDTWSGLCCQRTKISIISVTILGESPIIWMKLCEFPTANANHTIRALVLKSLAPCSLCRTALYFVDQVRGFQRGDWDQQITRWFYCSKCQKSSFFACFSHGLSVILSDFRAFWTNVMLFCGDLKPSSNTCDTRLYQNIFSTLAHRHYRPIIGLVWVLSWIWVRITTLKTSALHTFFWVLRS